MHMNTSPTHYVKKKTYERNLMQEYIYRIVSLFVNKVNYNESLKITVP